jgi:hypothetical protein
MAFYATHHEACEPTSFMFSSKLSSNYTSPSSQQSMGSLQQVFGSLNAYAAPPCYDAPVYTPAREPLVSYVPHPELLTMDQYQFNPAYPCVSPPDLQIQSPRPVIPPQTYSVYSSPLCDAKNQILLPAAPELPPADPPKRKGDRALARLHRSVRHVFIAFHVMQYTNLNCFYSRLWTQIVIGPVTIASRNSLASQTSLDISKDTLVGRTIPVRLLPVPCQ